MPPNPTTSGSSQKSGSDDSVKRVEIIDQIKVSVTDKVLYFGGTTGESEDVHIILPNTLEWIDKGNKTPGTVTVTFTSKNPGIVTIDSKGHMIARSFGTTTITTEVKLYNCETKTFKTTVTVKKPYITVSKSKSSMKIGETFVFDVNVFGFKKTDIVWTTMKKAVVLINRKTGKAIATSVGTDYVIAKIGIKSIKIKVVITK